MTFHDLVHSQAEAQGLSDHGAGLTPLPSRLYYPATSSSRSVEFEYFYFEDGRPGIPISHLTRYNPSQWIEEEKLRITVLPGRKEQKMSYRICTIHHKSYNKQKHVLRKDEGQWLPITAGKAAQSAADVVVRWLGKLGNPPHLRRNLCLDSLVQIGGSLQIYLGYRDETPAGGLFECIVKSPTSPEDQQRVASRSYHVESASHARREVAAVAVRPQAEANASSQITFPLPPPHSFAGPMPQYYTGQEHHSVSSIRPWMYVPTQSQPASDCSAQRRRGQNRVHPYRATQPIYTGAHLPHNAASWPSAPQAHPRVAARRAGQH